MRTSNPLPEQVLARLRPNERYWFWLTNRGPDGSPRLLIAPNAADPKGDAFRERKLRCQQSLSPTRQDHIGTATLMDRGVIQFRAPEPLGHFHGTLRRLIRDAGAGLNGAPFLRLLGSEYVRHQPGGEIAQPVSADAQWAPWIPDGMTVEECGRVRTAGVILRGIKPGDRAFFWHALLPSGVPLFLFEDQRSETRDGFAARMAILRQRLEPGPGLLGDVVGGKDGRLLFRSQSSPAGLTDAIAAFCRRYVCAFPPMARLLHAGHEVVADGNTRPVSVDPRLWEIECEAAPPDFRVVHMIERALAGAEDPAVFFCSFTPRTGTGLPALVLTPNDQGKEAHVVAEAKLDRHPITPWVRGRLRVMPGGGFQLKGKLDQVAERLQSFVSANAGRIPGLERLEVPG